MKIRDLALELPCLPRQALDVPLSRARGRARPIRFSQLTASSSSRARRKRWFERSGRSRSMVAISRVEMLRLCLLRHENSTADAPDTPVHVSQ